MIKNRKQVWLTAVICVSLLGQQTAVFAQNVSAPREPTTPEVRGPQAPSATRRILLNIARAVIEVLCAEYGDCPSNNSSAPSETTTPDPREERKYLTPSFAGNSARTRPAPAPRGFSFDTPLGWQAYEDQSSVTLARPSEYRNGDLLNGVILGLYDLNGAGFETGTETYVRALISNNKYLRRIGGAESSLINNVPCITSRMEGESPKTRYVEKVVVYTCRRNSSKLFYAVTVNSGPNAERFEEENGRVTQTISFR